jgi:hypothetical protein
MEYNLIAKILKKERCDKHIIRASVIPKSDSIELKCCCDHFKEKLIKQMQKEIRRQEKEANKYSEQIIKLESAWQN